jgi:hypothetical protein
MEDRDEMKPKSLIKNVMRELPFSADIYWLLRDRDHKPHSRFDLEALAARLPEVMAQAKPYIESTPQGKKVFFFASWHYWIMHAALSGLTLRGLGHDVTLGYLPYGDYDKPVSRFDLRRQDLYARQILKKTQPLLKSISLLDVRPSDRLPEELAEALEQLTVIDTQYIRQREDVTGTEPIYLLRKERNLEAARRALAYFAENRPDVVIIPNGMILEYGAIYETARHLGIPAVTYEFGEQDQRMWLGQNRQVMYYESFNDLWKTRQNRKLNEEQCNWLEDFLVGRQGLSKDGKFAHLWQKAGREGGVKIRDSLGLDDRPVVLLPTNVLGDSATLGRTVFSRSMTDWIEQVIPFFANRSEVQLVVRIHPAESWTVGPSVADIIFKSLPELPSHIHLIGPKEKVNTYDLMEIADLALVYTTTAGVEMATRGIPLLVSGRATYRKRGFTIDADSWEEYFQKLEQTLANLPANRLSQEQIDQAWNYAYAYFHEFTRPFPWHLEKIMADLAKRPISYVLSPEGRREYETTFQELAGAPIDWLS